MLAAHVGSINVVRTKDRDPLEPNAPEVDRHELARDLTAAVAVARIQDVGNRKRSGFVGRNHGRRLIDLGARGQHQVADPVLAAGVDDVDHPLDGNLDDQIGLRVKELRAVDVRKVADAVDAGGRGADAPGVADVPCQHLDRIGDLGQSPASAARFIIERANLRRPGPAP